MSELNQQSEQTQQIYHSLLLGETPLVDLRSPSEFEQGAFPASYSFPLMTDSERQKVGTCYKQQGQEAAIVLGYKLVEDDIKNRIEKWAAFKQDNPTAWLYCFRGGLRSQVSAKFLKERGIDVNIVPGGYKALRRYLIDTIERAAKQPIIVVGGKTGCAKTQLIQQLDNGLDIEGLANHRGSSFGKQVTPQPRQINYENQLAVEILKISQHNSSYVIEDESKSIGSLYVPLPLFRSMGNAPMVVIEDPLEVRQQRLCQEYCLAMKDKFCTTYGEELGWKKYDEYLHRGLYGIHKRLGLARFKSLNKVLDDALKRQRISGDCDLHLDWITAILKDYYDPMYQYQLSKKASRIQFKGSYQAVSEWLQDNK